LIFKKVFYFKIKGFGNSKQIKEEILKMSNLVGLNNELSKKAENLSGGMKRRLSVAMALVGDSKIIILDEPTSGLDPSNRISLWAIIQKYKPERTIIMTTHFMEEADLLCDRIAIMNEGEIKCCGSSSFLKENFGLGYRLTLNKKEGFDQYLLIDLLDEFFTNYLIETNIAAECTIALSVSSNLIIIDFLNKLEVYKYHIGIINYGISSSTIEEVFLK